MKNVCLCVLIFTNIVKVSLLVAHCAQLHMCSAVTLSKSDLQLFILNLHLGRCSYQLAAQTCLESDNNKAKLVKKGPPDGSILSFFFDPWFHILWSHIPFWPLIQVWSGPFLDKGAIPPWAPRPRRGACRCSPAVPRCDIAPQKNAPISPSAT